jgi:hypothetical protein
VRVNGVDDRGGRMTIETKVDDGPPAVTTDTRQADADISGDGEHTVTAKATDRAGNVSAPENLTVRIDATAPVSVGTLNTTTRSVRVLATDATSGVAGIEYAIGTGPWTPTAGAAITAPDANRHTVSYRAIDKAGNLETAKAVVIPADLSAPLNGNIAPIATPTASSTAGWNSVTALNDNADPANPSQAQIWGTWSGTRPQTQWVQYDWSRPVRIIGTELKFWRDAGQGTGDGVAQPDGWVLQYWDEATSAWHDVPGASTYGTSTTAFNNVTFDPITTSRVRATVRANGNGTTYSAVAITEWRVFAQEPAPEEPSEIPVTITVTPRCLAGKAYVAVQARNDHDAAVSITLESAYGERSLPNVAPGASAYQSFATRTASIAAGTVTVRAADEETTSVHIAEYPALTCA